MGSRDNVGWPATSEIRVPWRDVDAAGHVNNAVYFSYLEMARLDWYVRWLTAQGDAPREGQAARPEDVDFIIARQSCDYRTPAYLTETLVVRLWPTHVGRTSFTLAYELREKKTDRLVAEAQTVQVMFDFTGHQKKPLPDDLRKYLESGLSDAA